MNLQFPTLDGITPSWADINVKCMLSKGPLFDMADIAAIDTGGQVEIGVQKSGGRLMNRGTGDSSYTSSLTLYKSGWNKFLRNAAAVAPRRGTKALLRFVHFDLIVQHTPVGSREIYEFRVMGACTAGFTGNHAEGTDLDKIQLPLSVAEIVHIIDGIEVVLT